MSLLFKTQTRFLFHAHIRVKVPAAQADADFDVFYRTLESIDWQYNSYQPGSYFDRINRHAGEFVEVDEATVQLLQQAKAISDVVEGRYDISIMPLIRLWGFYSGAPAQVPTAAAIAEACARIDYRKIEIDGSAVRIGKEQELMTGSFIKAYATDCLVNDMVAQEVDPAIVNAGGSTIRAINSRPEDAWEINVSHPHSRERLFTLRLDNSAYSTSSQSSSFVDINGRAFGHILNPMTGYPSENQLLGIITDKCLSGDMLSTALFNETPDGFLEKITQLSGQYELSGFLMDKSGRLTFSPGFEAKLI